MVHLKKYFFRVSNPLSELMKFLNTFNYILLLKNTFAVLLTKGELYVKYAKLEQISSFAYKDC